MITLRRITSEHPDFRKLVQELDEDLRGRYGEIQDNYDKHNKIEKNNTVVLAYVDKMPVACGCFKVFENNTVEVKRMFVIPEQRGRGIGLLILQELETWARELKYTNLILETGKRQPEAIGLYTRAGFNIISNYGPYVNLELSICMSKSLI